MAQAKIFGSWSFNRRLPDPFGQEADRRGKRHTAESACLSKHNHMTRGKRATLHAGTLEGVIIAANILLGNKEGAFGAQIQNGMVKRCYLEYDKAGAAAPETRLLVYDPVKGQWSGMTVSGNTFVHYPQIGEYGSAGAGVSLIRHQETGLTAIGKKAARKSDFSADFSYQVNPIALRVGNDRIGGFLEGGLGHRGFVTAGVSLRF